jgi:hypothetical protein
MGVALPEGQAEGIAVNQIMILLRPYDRPEATAGVLDDILEAGEIRYTDQDGETQTAYVAFASIEEEREPAR